MDTYRKQLKTEAWKLLQFLNEEQLRLVLAYIDTLPKKKIKAKNTRTPEEIAAAVKAFEELNRLSEMIKPSPVIRDDKIAAAEAVTEKYNSLN